MKKIDSFTNLYSVSKTLRFKAIPIGKTEENIRIKRILDEDEERAAKYKAAKKIIDRFHIDFIENVLHTMEIEGLKEYVDLYNKKDKDDKDKTKILNYEEKMRKTIAGAFTKNKEFKILFSKNVIEDFPEKYIKDEEEKNIIRSFVGFSTAFQGFNENRKNMYSEEEKSTAIAYRCINENLPRFISNRNCGDKILDYLQESTISELEENLDIKPYTVKDIFSIEFFNLVLSNEGIAFYNTVLGGKTKENGEKIKGLNEYINLYNQQLPKSEKAKRLPLLKPLYKQVLSELDTHSFVIDSFDSDKDVIEAVLAIAKDNSDLNETLKKAEKLFEDINDFDLSGIYIKNGIAITNISKGVTGSWNSFQDGWNLEYDAIYAKKPIKDTEKYEEKRRKAYKDNDSFSILYIDNILKNINEDAIDVYGYIATKKKELIQDIYKEQNELLNSINSVVANNEKKLAANTKAITLIKNYLDSLKEFENFIKPIQGSLKETDRDEIFYGQFDDVLSSITFVDRLYDKVRNYVTKKSYSDDKYKLYFQNPQLLNGWDRSKVSDYRTTLLRKDGLYYLLVIDKSNSKILNTLAEDNEGNNYEVLDYKLISGASKSLPHVFFSSKGIEKYNPSNEVLTINAKKQYTKASPDFSLDKCHKLIDYYKKSISNHEWGDIYKFSFSETSSYKDISGFFREVDNQGYKLSFYKLSQEAIDSLVDEGKLYLFQLYNKDFSPSSHGTENLHTMLFKQAFAEGDTNLIKLCGGAELFFRKASISKEDVIKHPANYAVKNKNPLNEKKESLFTYDLIKDKRYTVDQYEIHIPITLNRTASGVSKLNESVREKLRKDANPHIIGIDRGERNLLYICVIDGKGKIVEQYSLNEIINNYNGNTYKTDYHDLLDRKEEDRLKARQEWTTIENIKELKEGYISHVIHKICSLVIKYDAIVAMEDLNSGFKNSRVKVEKQVYQKFEKALIDKFNYLSDKSIPVEENGSIANAFQLANPFVSFKSMGTQNGFIFYIPAWLTSKIDPVTGFVDLLKPKYTSVEMTKEFISNIDKISYTGEYFEFKIDYSKYPKTEASYTKEWTICSVGNRIKTYRNPLKNNEWDNEEINLTNEFKQLFDNYGISYTDKNKDIKNQILNISEKEFYYSFIYIFRLMLQMRNSITGNVDVDYLISPVKGPNGRFYDSRNCDSSLPQNADANGAYNIARKALWAVEQFKIANIDDLGKTKIAISNKDWLKFAQSNN